MVPSCFLTACGAADTKVCADRSEDLPNITSNVSDVVLDTANHSSPAGSDALGYAWLEVLSSLSQVNTILPSSI